MKLSYMLRFLSLIRYQGFCMKEMRGKAQRGVRKSICEKLNVWPFPTVQWAELISSKLKRGEYQMNIGLKKIHRRTV